jgi:site-specific DNA recombinase
VTTAIGLARLSVDTDESTSIARQRQAIRSYCDAQGWELLAIAEDVDVSGKTPVLDRPEAGKLLRAGGYQKVVFLKLDRCSRNVVDFRTFAQWCDDSLLAADSALASATARARR